MKYRLIFLLFLLWSTMIIMSCDDEDPIINTSRVGFQFFPLQVGQSSIYEVEEISYFITGDVDTNRFELKMDVVDSFLNQSGELNYIIHRSIKEDAAEEFSFLETWSAIVDDNRAIEIEGSTPFIRISFPLSAGKEWDGNSINTLDEDTYEMDSLFSTYITTNNDTINSTLTVIQGDNQDFVVELDRRFEVYGENVGLVYREDIQLVYCTDEDCIGQQIIESGRELRQTLISHVKK